MTRLPLKKDDTDEIDQLCIYLFDLWCERRSLVPLAYLMHAWPMLTPGPLARSRLMGALHDLQEFHADTLAQDEHRVIDEVLGSTSTQ